MISPEAILGSHAAFCSGVPAITSPWLPIPTLVPNAERKAGVVRPNSIATRASSAIVRPRPPYSSAIDRPNRPMSRISAMTASGMVSFASTSASSGRSRSATKRRTVSISAANVSGSSATYLSLFFRREGYGNDHVRASLSLPDIQNRSDGAGLAGLTERTIERGTIPAAEIGGDVVGRLAEGEQRRIGIGRAAHRIIAEQELAKRRIPRRALRHHAGVGIAGRRGIGISVESGLRIGVAAGPEADARLLVAIRLAGHGIGQAGKAAGMARRRAAGKTRRSEIEAAPEKVDRARLAEEASAECAEHALHLDQRAPEAAGGLPIIGSLGTILGEGHRIRHFAGLRIEPAIDVKIAKRGHHRGVEIGNRAGFQRDQAFVTVARREPHAISQQIEIDLEKAIVYRDRRGRPAARGEVERHMPTMVEPRRQREPHLADDLAAQLQPDRRLAPVAPIERGPGASVAHPTAVPPTVSPSTNKVGWPTPAGTPCPALPHMPMPSSSAKSLPMPVTFVSTVGPSPISVAPLIGAPSLP